MAQGLQGGNPHERLLFSPIIEDNVTSNLHTGQDNKFFNQL